MELPNILFDRESSQSTGNTYRASICVIGGGPCGLAALKVLKDAPQFLNGDWHITVFESRESLGGIWLPTAPTDDPPLTPLYDSLTTNIPHPLMAYPSLSFPPSTPLFPPASTVLTYLESYATHFDLRKFMRFGVTVDSVEWDGQWIVRTSTGETSKFNFLVVANGHYRIPRYPDTSGLPAWFAARAASHSAWYRRPHDLGSVVLVIGGGPSGLDIAVEMRAAAKTVIHSMSNASPSDHGNLKIRPRVKEFGDPKTGRVVFEDGSSESGISHCILATGYEFSFPFLSSALVRETMPPPPPPLTRALHNSTYHLFPLARQVFPLQSAVPYPLNSLAFIGLPVKVAPFPVAEAQAAAAARVFADPTALDSTREAIDIVARAEELRREVGDQPVAIAKVWHRFQPHEQFEYRDELHGFAGDKRRVSAWELEIYDNKNVLREEWRALEDAGEAAEWVRGVGEGGLEEWVQLMRRLLRRANDREREADAKM